MKDQEIRPGVRLHSGLGLYLAEHEALVVADLHWGYALSQRRAGLLMPLWGDDVIEKRLQHLLDFYQPRAMIWLGDSLHRVADRLPAEEFLRHLEQKHPSLHVHLLSGNHDRAWSRLTASELRLGNYLLHHGHEPRLLQPGDIEIIGHEHPAVTWRDGAGLRLKVPALVMEPQRWILPAFSPWAGHVDWSTRLGPEDELWSISPRRILLWPRPKNPVE